MKKRAQLLAKSLKREPGVGAEREAENNHFSEKFESSQEVPQIKHLDLDINQLNIDDLQVMASLQSPNTSLASRSPLGLSSSSSSNAEEDDSRHTTQAFIDSDDNTKNGVGVDTNGNSFDDTNSSRKFCEIDLNN